MRTINRYDGLNLCQDCLGNDYDAETEKYGVCDNCDHKDLAEHPDYNWRFCQKCWYYPEPFAKYHVGKGYCDECKEHATEFNRDL